jgi:hypothetical protein
MQRCAVLGVLVLGSAYARNAAAQRLTPDVPARSAAISIDAQVAGKSYQGSGGGICGHADEASIHDVSASLWTVEFSGHSGPLKQLSLTLWRPKEGSQDQLLLSLETSSGSHRIQTGRKNGNSGEASVTILPSGPGGRLEIKGKEGGGKPIQIAIECPLFGDVDSAGNQ